ncbi:MAG: YerC/YecD family TrpR-related protein, partial [Clostridia bacterium]|nr:YerC/YecD family TrpR-related protein [Clostridia bacterium]
MSYENKLKETALDNLFEAILALKSLGDCYAFFEDLCTVSELKSM